MHRSSTVCKFIVQNSFDVRGQQTMDFFTGGNIMDFFRHKSDGLKLEQLMDLFSYKHAAFHFKDVN